MPLKILLSRVLKRHMQGPKPESWPGGRRCVEKVLPRDFITVSTRRNG